MGRASTHGLSPKTKCNKEIINTVSIKICTDVLVSQTEIYVEIKLYPNFADIKTVFSAHGCMTYIMWMSLSGYLGLVWLLWPDVNLIFFKICIYL